MNNNHNLHDLNGERKEQLLILVDKESGEKTGEATREACHKGKGLVHLAFIAFIIDEKRNIVLAKRSEKKSLWSGFWDAAVVSHVLSGETAGKAAERRAKEEMGVDMEFESIGSFYYFTKHNEYSENEYCHVLIGKTDRKLTSNPVEISEVRNVPYAKLQDEINAHKELFTPWFLLAMEKYNLSKYI